MLVADLEPHIHVILSAPGTDLSTISAKRVRRLLFEQNDAVPLDLVKNNKKEIDALIAVVFARVSEEKGFAQDDEAGVGDDYAESPAPSAGSKKRHRAAHDDDDVPSAKATKPSTAGDEALARQLSEEINGRSRASRSAAASGASSGARSPRSRSWTGSRSRAWQGQRDKKRRYH
jgi:upstream activation factor subunit UAF30